MGKVIIHPAATLEARPGDETPIPEQLETIGHFKGLKKQLTMNPGSVVLRRYGPGDTIVEQGDAGWTAFYILKASDVVALREVQLKDAQEPAPGESGGGLRGESGGGLRGESGGGLRGDLERELAVWRERAKESAAAKDGRRAVATVFIQINLPRKAQPKGLFGRLVQSLTGGPKPKKALPKSISIDGPNEISLEKRRDDMYEGDVFGEMSCTSRVPRSATVVANVECYVLEMLRNILEQVRRNETYRRQFDDDYRRRALGPQLRKLPIFGMLDDDQFEQVRKEAELVSAESGDVIFDEGDPSDGFYVVRRGLVKVVKDKHYLVRIEKLPDGQRRELIGELAKLEHAQGVAGTVWKAFDAAAQTAVRQAAAALPGADPGGTLASIERAVNRLIAAPGPAEEGPALAEKLAANKSDLLAAIDDPRAEALLEAFPEKVKEWTGEDRHEFHRWLLESLCPRGLPKRQLQAKDSRTLTYLGRGEFFGEAGVLLETPRSATCVAFGHPEGGGVASTVELVRIPMSREALEKLCRSKPDLKASFDEQIKLYKQRDARPAQGPRAAGAGEITTHPRFEELGLIQGQKLMVIDLDRCTRCGECMRACVDVHDDGASRLFLDGPRFGKYLVPNTCRKCLDPVCMIGCPVGSIIRGDNGEIEILDWCIGCAKCADNCPYGSIQMNQLSDLDIEVEVAAAPAPLGGDQFELKEITERAVVCDLCSHTASKEPACVYHCPHDAAFRIDARYEFPAGT